METRKFTKADGLKIQASQMAEWKIILKPAVYKALEAAVNEANARITSDRGSAVSRGVALNNWIGNYTVGHRNHKLY